MHREHQTSLLARARRLSAPPWRQGITLTAQGASLVIAPHLGLISPKTRFLGLTRAPAILAVGCPQMPCRLPFPAPSILPRHRDRPPPPTTKRATSRGCFCKLFLLSSIHTFLQTPLPDLKVPLGDHSMWARNSTLKTSSVRKAHSCDPQLRGGRHPPSCFTFHHPTPQKGQRLRTEGSSTVSH